MALTIYGTAASRAVRPLWVAAELALDYTHIPVPYLGGATRSPEFLAINPNGHIPALDDDGVVVWESMACALYLAERFSSPVGSPNGCDLWARDSGELAAVLGWAFWAVTECEKDALVFLMHTDAMAPERRKPALALEAARRRAGPLKVLEQHLERAASRCVEVGDDAAFLAGRRFTVADVCVASVLAWVVEAQQLMAPLPHVRGWLQRCLTRPAYLHVQLMAKTA